MTFLPDFTPVFASNGLVYAFQNSDWMGQFICVFLFFCSVFVWVLMLDKGSMLRKGRRASEIFVKQFRNARDPLSLRDRADESNSPAAHVYAAACKRIQSFKLEFPLPRGGRRAMSDDELEIVRSTMNLAVEDELVLLERKNIFLATAVSAAPFFGLFGTVWGITMAFSELAIAGRADVQTLAPGISGALLTTVIGLVVAIPSLIGYNIISTQIKNITVHLDNFVDEVYTKFKIEQLESYSAAERRENQQ